MAQQRAIAPAAVAVRIKTSRINGARATLAYDILLSASQVAQQRDGEVPGRLHARARALVRRRRRADDLLVQSAAMRVALCVIAVAAFAGSALAGATTTTAKTTPAGTLKAEIAAFNAKNYRAA